MALIGKTADYTKTQNKLCMSQATCKMMFAKTNKMCGKLMQECHAIPDDNISGKKVYQKPRQETFQSIKQIKISNKPGQTKRKTETR